MKHEEKSNIKVKILEEIANLELEIQKLEQKYTPIAQDCSLDYINRKDMQLEQEITNKIAKEAQIRLKKLRATLKRVEEPHYGICLECDDFIAINRLMILPESLYCVACMNELGL